MRPNDTTIDLSGFAGTWTLDPEQSSVTCRTKGMWVFPIEAAMKALAGSVEITPDGGVSGSLIIDAASIDTKNKKRDDHLRSDDFLDVAKFPTFVFRATGVRLAGADLVEITGVLTVHGQTRPLTLQARVNRSGNSATVSTEVEIDRSLWGVTWDKMGAGLKNQVTIRAQFAKQPDSGHMAP